MMKQYGFSWSAALMAVGVGALAWAGPEAVQNVQKPALSRGTPVVFGFGGEGNQEFMLNGKPFQIRGAEMHPQRIPREYWRHRIRTAKAMGLNTIAFYVFWNDHEQPDGSFDFKTGNRDLEGFLKLCQEEGMWVLFRPGPYACGEWDLGGLPHYLLKDPKAKLRTTEDAKFMKAQTRYLEAVARGGGPFFLLCDHVASVILSLGDSTYWTGSLTCSTIDAGISINNICIFAFRNCTYRTFSFASTTLYTFITNYTCHGYVSSFFNFKTDNFRFVIYILIQESKIYKG